VLNARKGVILLEEMRFSFLALGSCKLCEIHVRCEALLLFGAYLSYRPDLSAEIDDDELESELSFLYVADSVSELCCIYRNSTYNALVLFLAEAIVII
jgi:hypothetical protein